MKILFCIQGEGRGHLTQAIAAREVLETAGHQVVGVAVGMGHARQLPAFFASAMPTSVTVLPTLEFVFRNNRAVHLPATVAGVVAKLPEYVRALRRLRALVREFKPDVNFFEPLAGIYALTTRNRPPVQSGSACGIAGATGQRAFPRLAVSR